MPMQQRFKEDPALEKFIFGGNRSGKSEGTADCVVDEALATPNQKIWVCGETFQDSIAIQQKKINDLVPVNEVEYGNYSVINGYTNRKLLFKNGTIITFKSYDQGVDTFQSEDIDLIWNDEEPPWAIYKEQRMRLIDRNGKMLISMTSLKGVTDLIEDIYQDHDIVESQYSDVVGEDLPRVAEKNGSRFYFLWTHENPHINQERVLKECRMMTTPEKKARFHGIPLNLAGRIYIKFNQNIHGIASIEDMPEGHYTLFNILDPHDRKPWAMIWVALHAGTDTAYVVDELPEKAFNEIEYDDKTYKEYAKLIRNKEKSLRELFGVPVRRRIIDPNFGNKTIQLAERQGNQSTTTPKKRLRKHGLYYRDGIDALEAGHLEVREWIHWEEKQGEIVVQPKLYVLDSCHNTIKGMSRYSRKDVNTADGDVKDKVGPKEKWKDFPDCVRYFVMSNPQTVEEMKEPEEQGKMY